MQTAFFGIGAMRAGTSWLADVLQTHPDCGISPIKELHFFDRKYGIAAGRGIYCRRVRYLKKWAALATRRLSKDLDGKDALESCEDDEFDTVPEANRATQRLWDGKLEENAEWEGNTEAEWEEVQGEGAPPAEWANGAIAASATRSSATCAEQDVSQILNRLSALAELLTVRDLETYRDYLKRYAGPVALGEISPSYAMLPSEAFVEMNSLFPGAKFIFIMRDPVDRIWSHVRRWNGRSKKRGRTSDEPNVQFAAALQKQPFVARSNYHDTIMTLEKVIPQEQIIYLFYERMTSSATGPSEIERLQQALGLSPCAVPQEKFNSPKNAAAPNEISPENEAAAVELLAPTYRFVKDRFGQPEGWRCVA